MRVVRSSRRRGGVMTIPVESEVTYCYSDQSFLSFNATTEDQKPCFYAWTGETLPNVNFANNLDSFDGQFNVTAGYCVYYFQFLAINIGMVDPEGEIKEVTSITQSPTIVKFGQGLASKANEIYNSIIQPVANLFELENTKSYFMFLGFKTEYNFPMITSMIKSYHIRQNRIIRNSIQYNNHSVEGINIYPVGNEGVFYIGGTNLINNYVPPRYIIGTVTSTEHNEEEGVRYINVRNCVIQEYIHQHFGQQEPSLYGEFACSAFSYNMQPYMHVNPFE